MILQHYKHILQERGGLLWSSRNWHNKKKCLWRSLTSCCSLNLWPLTVWGDGSVCVWLCVSGWRPPSFILFILIFRSAFLTFHHSSFDVWSNYRPHQIRQVRRLTEAGPATEKKGSERTFQHKSMWNWLLVNTVCTVKEATQRMNACCTSCF